MTDKQIREQVIDLLRSNVSQGYSKLLKTPYCYIKPSPGTYPFQWWWDMCFEAFMLCALGKYDLAKRTMSSLFAMQQDDGFVGHMIFWESVLPKDPLNVLQAKPTWRLLRPHMNSLIQPPLVAQAVLHIYQTTQERSFLQTMLPKVKAYHQWLSMHRDFEGDGLLTIITPFESGMDWSPSFDPVVGFSEGQANWKLYWKVISVNLRNFLHPYDLPVIYQAGYFLVKDVALNTIYAQDLLALAQLGELTGDKECGHASLCLEGKGKHGTDVTTLSADRAIYNCRMSRRGATTTHPTIKLSTLARASQPRTATCPATSAERALVTSQS